MAGEDTLRQVNASDVVKVVGELLQSIPIETLMDELKDVKVHVTPEFSNAINERLATFHSGPEPRPIWPP